VERLLGGTVARRDGLEAVAFDDLVPRFDEM